MEKWKILGLVKAQGSSSLKLSHEQKEVPNVELVTFHATFGIYGKQGATLWALRTFGHRAKTESEIIYYFLRIISHYVHVFRLCCSCTNWCIIGEKVCGKLCDYKVEIEVVQ